MRRSWRLWWRSGHPQGRGQMPRGGLLPRESRARGGSTATVDGCALQGIGGNIPELLKGKHCGDGAAWERRDCQGGRVSRDRGPGVERPSERSACIPFPAQSTAVTFHRVGSKICGIKAWNCTPLSLLSDQPLGGLCVVCCLWGELWTQTLTGWFHRIMQTSPPRWPFHEPPL